MKKVYNIKPIGIVFANSPSDLTFTTLNGEEFKRTKKLEFLAEQKPKPPLNIPERVTNALLSRDYNIDLVKYEIRGKQIEKRAKALKKEAKKQAKLLKESKKNGGKKK